MFRVAFIIYFFLPINIYAQTLSADTSSKSCITSPGTPFGNTSTAKMGSSGGTIKSADGKLEIVFPAGALEKETDISIQSINNKLTEENSGAYRLKPSGISFKKPVQLLFYYDGYNKNTGPKSIATQDETGRWIGLKKTETDIIGKTVSGSVLHFSDWVLFNHYDLLPAKTTVRVNESQLLEVRHLTEEGEKSHGGLIQFGVPLITEKVIVDKWTVNGIQMGNAETGIIQESGRRWGIYVAPAKVPSQNPVAITAYFSGKYFELAGPMYKNFSLTSSILVKDFGYRFTYTHKNFAGCFHTIDSSSCIVKLDGPTAIISDIINYKPWSDWDPCTKCNSEYTNKETFKANVEIWGMAGSKITAPTKEKPMIEVYITLLPSFGNTPAQWQQCPKSPRIEVPSFALSADPKYIHFEINGNEIIVHYFGITGKNFISKKVKNEETIIKVEKL